MWPYRIIIVREEVVILKNRPTEGEASYVVSDSMGGHDMDIAYSKKMHSLAHAAAVIDSLRFAYSAAF